MSEARFSFAPNEWEKIIADLQPSSVIVIGDHNTQTHCWPKLLKHCPSLDRAHKIWLPPGESEKSVQTAEKVWNQLLDVGADRKSLVVSLGGGVISDLCGFVATTYKRGINFVYVPTTNLAMCDAAIGGKTGINLAGFKNQIGTIQWPAAILYDAAMLATLPENVRTSGFAETIKHALIADPSLWSRLKNGTIAQDWDNWDIMSRSIDIKRKIVAQDLGEKDIRQALNFGHSAGHGLESLAASTGLNVPHGYAVAFGMVTESWLSHKLTGLSTDTLNEIVEFLSSQYQLPWLQQVSVNDCLPYILQDKKNHSGEIRCTLLNAVGQVSIDQKITPDKMMDALHWAKEKFG